MNAYFPITVFEFATRNGIVKILCILWVNGEGDNIPEIFTLSQIFLRDSLWNLICCFLHTLRIDIWQSEFSQDSMHLCIILTSFS